MLNYLTFSVNLLSQCFEQDYSQFTFKSTEATGNCDFRFNTPGLGFYLMNITDFPPFEPLINMAGVQHMNRAPMQRSRVAPHL